MPQAAKSADLARMVLRRIKSVALRALTAGGIRGAFRPLTRNAAVVFMLHRFRDPERSVKGYEQAVVRELLEFLRRERYRLVDLEALFRSLRGEAPPLQHAVAFTIDDGYREHATVASPVFAEFDCPVTTFVATGFLDEKIWFWWDQIEYVLTRTSRRELSLEIGDEVVHYSLTSAAERHAAQEDFTGRCKTMTEARKHDVIRLLSDRAEVRLPTLPPPEYAPMTWSQLRECERRGMRFGPHTVTHPILARTDDAQARLEIVESWARLRAEAAHPTPIFAYPNGQLGDFGDREFRVLREAGFLGAVTGAAGFATARRHHTPNGPFLMPRFPFPDSLTHLIQQVGGLERLKFLIRGMD